MRTNWLCVVLTILILVGSACAAQTAQGSAKTATNDEAAVVLWEGPALFAEDSTECHRLSVTQDYRAFVGLCDGEQTDTPQGRITFNGHGEIAGPAWEHAIANWAQFTHAELASGRVGAANRTVLAWNLGEQSNQPNKCQMLLVLVHGYATAGLTPCAGGQIEVITSDWIDLADWEQFDTWLYTTAPFYRDNNYFDGRGAIELSAKEVAVLAEWVETVYAKLIQK